MQLVLLLVLLRLLDHAPNVLLREAAVVPDGAALFRAGLRVFCGDVVDAVSVHFEYDVDVRVALVHWCDPGQ